LCALIIGGLYWFGALGRSDVVFTFLSDLPPTLVVIWKALATGLLVVSVSLVIQGRAAQMLLISLCIIWLADILLAVGFTFYAGLIFIIAHILSSLVYFRSRSNQPSRRYNILSLLVFLMAIGIAIHGIFFVNEFNIISIFPMFSATSAALAWRSKLPQHLNALGASLFFMSDAVFVVASNLSIDVTSVGWIVWATYFMGLAFISRGIIKFSEE